MWDCCDEYETFSLQISVCICWGEVKQWDRQAFETQLKLLT